MQEETISIPTKDQEKTANIISEFISDKIYESN